MKLNAGNDVIQTSVQSSIVGAGFVNGNEKFYNDLIDNLPIAIYVCDKNGYIQSYNKAAIELWQREPEIGKERWDGATKIFNVDGSIIPLEESSVAQTLKEGKVVTGKEMFIERPDQSRVCVLTNPQLLYDVEGELKGVINTLLDITEIRRSQEVIQENEEKLRVAINATGLGTFEINLLTDEIEYSDRYLEIYGFDKNDRPTRREVIDTLHPNDKIKRLDSFEEALNSGWLEYKARVPLKSGGIRWIKVKGKVIFDANNKPIKTLGTVADITETKIAEEKLAKLAAVVQSSEDAIIGKRLDGTITSWNDAAERIFGYTESEMLGDSIYKLIPEDRIDEEKNIIEKITKGERVHHFETKRVRKDKSEVDISLSVSPIKDPQGKIIGASKIARDITEQKKIENIVSENEHRLNMAVQAAEMGTWELDMLTDEVRYSKRYLEILELDPLKKPDHNEILKVIHPDDKEIRMRALKVALDTGILDLEMRIKVGENKTTKWIRSRGKVFYDADRKPIKMMGTILDITRQKTIFETLRTSEEKFRLLANSMPQLVWTSDTKGNLNYFNQSVYDYSGITQEQIEKDGWLQIVHPDDREENIHKWQHAIETGKDFLFEHRFRKHNGEYRWQLSRAIPQRDDEGAIQMWVGTSTDIHEIKENEQQKDLFISMASHELKTPITSIKGYVQILMKMHQNGNDDFLKTSLITVDKQIGILTNLIGDLLDLSKIKSGNLQLNKEEFCLNEMVNEVVNDIQPTEPGHTFVFTSEKECYLFADKGRIGQVLINFLTNAIKYSPNSTLIKISSGVVDDYAVVSVEDSGIGINKADQKKIFNRFYRVEGKDEKTFPGFGIGLFIASEIIQRHEGKIEVKSEPGKGSIFSFYLPLENT